MKDIYEKIWALAYEYQDKRNDGGHAEVALNFAQRLIVMEDGNEDVVIPAIILHDIGWSQLTEKDRLLIFDKNAAKEDRQRVVMLHQENSVDLARSILNKVSYPPEMIEEILEIISQHDSREGFISNNEGLVRDADKLWRVSKGGVAADVRRSNDKKRFQEIIDATDRKNYFYSESAKQIARAEIADRRKE